MHEIVSGQTSVHGSFLVVSVELLTDLEGVKMRVDEHPITLHVFNQTFLGLIPRGASSLLIEVVGPNGVVGEALYDINRNLHLREQMGSGPCVHLLD